MAVSDYSTKDVQVGANTYVKPVNTGIAEAIGTIGEVIQEVRTGKELDRFTDPLRKMKENVIDKGATAPQEALFIQGKLIESKLATGMLTEEQLSDADRELLTTSRQMILDKKMGVEQGLQKITSLQISAEAFLRDNIRRRPDLAPQFRAIVRNELGMDVEGAAVQDYIAQLKKLEEEEKPTLSFSQFNDFLKPMQDYVDDYGNSEGGAKMAAQLLDLRTRYARGDQTGAIAAATVLSAGLTANQTYDNITQLSKAEGTIASIEKKLEDAILKPLPATEDDRAKQTEAARVVKTELDLLRTQLSGYDFSAKSESGKRRDATVARINNIIEQYYDPENGEFSEKKYVQTRAMKEEAMALRMDAQPMMKLYPITQNLDEPTQKAINNSVSIGSQLTSKGYIDNPAIRAQITGTKVNNALNGLASSTGRTESSIKNNPEAHLLSFLDITAPFTYEIYSDRERTNRVYVPASEFWSSGGGVLPRIARSLGPNGYVDKLYNESGDPKIIDLALSQLMTRASETMYRELSKTNLPNASYTAPDGTIMSSSEVLRTYFAPADYQAAVASYYDKGSPKTFRLTSSGDAVMLRPRQNLNALPKAEQNKIYDIWDKYNEEAGLRYKTGLESFLTIFIKLNDRLTGTGE